MNTTVYLIRHSVRFNTDLVESYHSDQSNTIKNEKIPLSILGEQRAEILSNESELQNLDVVYTSNSVRTLQTAKYILAKQNLGVHIDDRFDERRVGIPNKDRVPDWWLKQFTDKDYKTEGGESQVDVRNRFTESFNEIMDNHKGKRIAIFTHGYAITFFLMTWCKFEYDKENDNLILIYKDKEVINNKINAPDVFKLEFDENNNLLDIKNIKFDDLPYMGAKDGVDF